MGRTDSPQDVVLGFVREAAERREAAEQHFRRTVVAARALDLPLSVIAAASGLSVSRVQAIANEEQGGNRVSPTEARVPDRDVLVVAAGRAAAQDYLDYNAYVCQAYRPFRDVPRMGFYRRRRVEPYFPMIRERIVGVDFTRPNIERLRQTGSPVDRELADVIERMLDSGRRTDGATHDVFLLTPPNDPRTLMLDQPVRHMATGRGSAWTQGTRYTNEASLQRNPKTTDELD